MLEAKQEATGYLYQIIKVSHFSFLLLLQTSQQLQASGKPSKLIQQNLKNHFQFPQTHCSIQAESPDKDVFLTK
jgi:hypothetical protein